jgi:hypothetical protein
VIAETSMPPLLETAGVVSLLEDNGMHVDRCRAWRISDALGLKVREPGSTTRRSWTPDQAQLVLLAAQLKVSRGFSARRVQQLAASAGGRHGALVDELRTVYQRVANQGGLDSQHRGRTAA